MAGGGGGGVSDRCLGGGGGADRPMEGGGGMIDRWSPALEKNAARRRVRLSAKARGAVAGRGGGGADKPLEGGGA